MEWVICTCFKTLFFQMTYPEVYLFRLYYTTPPTQKRLKKFHFFYKSGWPRCGSLYRDADKSLAQPGRKQATATEDFDVHISYL